MAQLQADDRLLIHLFQKSLTGPALKWFTSLDMATIKTWNDLGKAFLEQYSFNLDLVPKREDLVALKQRNNEPFGEYIGRWRVLAAQVRDRPSDEESIEIIIRGAQPSTGALLAIQAVTSFASLIRVGTRMESTLRSGNFPVLSVFAKQATSPSNGGSSSNTNNNGGGNNNNPRRRDPPRLAVAYVDSPAAPVHMVALPGTNQVVYAPTPSAPHTPQITTTTRPVYSAPPVRQGQHQGQRWPHP